jgi:colanic acid/amylovoran biosynthesis protein
MTKRIAIIGSALAGNKGAAAMLESAIQTLGDKDTEFTLLSMYPRSDTQQNPYKNLRIVDASPLRLGVVINSLALLHRLVPPLRNTIVRKSPAIKALVEADVLLDQGGITFVDGREKFLLYNVASILPALNLKTPVVKCAQAMGPFNNPINNWAAKTYLPKMAAVVTRGRITHEYVNTLQLPNVTAGADYAFSLELTPTEAKVAKKKFDVSLLKGKKVVGVSPSVVMQKKVDGNDGDYAREMVLFIDYLTANGYGVMLVPHSVRSNTEKTHNNDMPLCQSVYAKLNDKDDVLFLDQELGSQELRYWIGKCDYFIASRFHAMVSSLAMEVPTLVIGWSHKYREVLEMFELEEWAFGQNKLSTQHLKAEFERLVNDSEVVKQKLHKHLPEVKAKSLKQVEVIKRVISKFQ